MCIRDRYFISTHGARKGLADTALKTANSGYLTRRLVDVTQDLVVTEDDCGTSNGMNMRALVEGGEIIESLRDRILGRVTATEVLHPETQEVLLGSGQMLDEEALDLLEAAGCDEVKVRTALTCDTRFGICAKCYGRDLGRGGLVNVGEAIGVIAAQSIGEPGTQLTMRTFHIGGAASRAAVASSVDAKSDGIIGFNATMRYVTNGKGVLVVISRSGEIVISDQHGRERERHKLPYGATLNIRPDQQIKAGTVLANWDPLTRPIITEFAGRAKFENVEEGVTVAKQVDEVTGLSTLVVIDPKRRGAAKVVRPQVKLLDAAGIEVKIPGTDHSVTIGFPVGALIQVRDGQDLAPGEVLARIPMAVSYTHLDVYKRQVPQDRIGGRLEHAVERQRQLDCTEIAAQVAGVLGNRLHDEVANLTSEIRELGKAQFAKVGGLPDVLQRHGGLTLPAGAGSCRHSGQPGTKATDVPR